MAVFQRILVAVDGSECSTLALERALQLARDSGVRLKLLHVVDTLMYLTGFEGSHDVFQIIKEQAARVLGASQQVARAAGVEVETELLDHPGQTLGDAVAGAARRWKADLVIVGTHGRRGMGRLLLGSGAEQIIRLAPAAVLVVRAPTPEQAGAAAVHGA